MSSRYLRTDAGVPWDGIQGTLVASLARLDVVSISGYTSRRNTLIVRKVTKLYPDLVSDEEVVAYY